MNKTQLVDAMSIEAGISKVAAKKALDAFIAVTTQALSEDDKITLVGFGTFSLVNKPGRVGRNFKTGAPIKITARKDVKFKAGSDLLEQIK